MIDSDAIDDLSPEQRLKNIAAILATGILRLQRRSALNSAPDSETETNLFAKGLEVPAETRLSVRVG